MKSPLKAKLLARIVHEQALATRHYNNAFRSFLEGARLQAAKEKVLAIRHGRNSRALERRILPSIHFDEDAKITLQSVWRQLLPEDGAPPAKTKS